MRCDGGRSKILDLAGLADIDAMHADFAVGIAADLGGELLQSRFVAVGEREIAAARGQFQRQCAADAAGGAGDGGGTSGNRSHFGSISCQKGRELAKNCGLREFGKLEPNHKAVSALNREGRGNTTMEASQWDNRNPCARPH
jgi:hypothetical protein